MGYKKYETLLFDADNTLFDFHRAEREAIKETLCRFSLPCDDGVIAEYSAINDSLWKLLEIGGIEKNELRLRRFKMLCDRYGFSADAEAMASAYTERLARQAFLTDGAEDICSYLFGRYRMYIVTNGTKFVQESRMERSGLGKYFEKVFISDDLGAEKPSVRFFELVAERLGAFDKSKTLIIGDSLSSDIAGGNAFGIDTCWLDPSGEKDRGDLDVTFRIRALCDLKNIL